MPKLELKPVGLHQKMYEIFMTDEAWDALNLVTVRVIKDPQGAPVAAVVVNVTPLEEKHPAVVVPFHDIHDTDALDEFPSEDA